MYDFECDSCGHEFDMAENIKEFMRVEYIESLTVENVLKFHKMSKKHIIIVEDDYYIEHMKLFHAPQCRITKTIIDDDLFKDDMEHTKLVKARRKADKELIDYEYNKRFK